MHRGLGERARTRAHSERGFTLIEVLMTALLVTLIAGAVAGALMTNIHATASQHRQTVAQALAEQDQERLKGLSSEQLDNLNQTYNTTFDSYQFSVHSQAWYLSNTNTTACASSGTASATYFKTISTVSWTNPSGVNQVAATNESVISPAAGGGILAQFHDQTASPLSGVAVSATGPDSDAATSDSNGCVIFSALPTGNYNLSFTDTGYVDPNGNTAAPLNATASVASTGFAAPSTGNPVELGQGGGVAGSFAIQYGSGPSYPAGQATAVSWLSPGGAGIPMATYRYYPTSGSSSSGSFTTQTVTGTGSSPQGLFPFVSSQSPVSYTNNYQLWAGKCLQEQPPAGTNMFTVGPAASLASQAVLVPALLLTTTYKAANGTVSNITPADVKATFTNGNGTSCSDEWSVSPATVTPALAAGTNLYGVPFAASSSSNPPSASGQTGTVSVCADYKPSGTNTYYQMTASGLTPAFTSTTSKTFALTTTSTTGKCT